MNSKSNLHKIGAKKSHRVALKKNILSDLIIFEHLKTTKAKAKAVAPLFDKVVMIAKKDLPKRELERKLIMKIGNKIAVEKLINVFAKRFEKESNGLVRLFALQRRKGDGAEQIQMIVKGYSYKEIGKKISSVNKKGDKTEKENVKNTQAFDNENYKGESQVIGKISTSKVKSRSGI